MDQTGRRFAPRLQGFDYRAARAYFVTLCTMRRRRVLGYVLENGTKLSPVGEIVAAELNSLAGRYLGLSVEDTWVVMPDHLHAIIWLPQGSCADLPEAVGLFKAGCTRECHRLGLIPPSWSTLWQRSFYDRVIRTDRELSALRRYITENPRRWHEKRGGINPTPTEPRAG